MIVNKCLSKVIPVMLIFFSNCSILSDIQEAERGCNYSPFRLPACYKFINSLGEEQNGTDLLCFQTIYYYEQCKKRLKNNPIDKL